FAIVESKLADANMAVICFASTIGNPSKALGSAQDDAIEVAGRAAVRMKRLGTKLIRIMSYAVQRDDLDEARRFARLREIVAIFGDAGITAVHENCCNYGGMGWTYTLRLIENVPGLALLFDTGNPARDDDWSGSPPYPKQSAWSFYEHVRDHIRHVHIKDGVWDARSVRIRYTLPGEGEGDIARILSDLRKRSYSGAVSIEPHTAGEWRDGTIRAERDPYSGYLAYARHLEQLIEHLP
ncbi:MAG TPA: sugar phosphate isomerase/epimerase family protein, partial [Tepidisphaeraceae bacterium]